MQPKKITELNGAHETDSHAGLCGYSRLMPDFRETITLEGQSHPAISSKVYYPIDLSASVAKSTILQQVGGDCAIVSMATVEAYLHGVTSDAEKKR